VFSHLRVGRMRNKQRNCTDSQLELIDQRPLFNVTLSRPDRQYDSLHEGETASSTDREQTRRLLAVKPY
jgi:hypothetical protein